MDFGQRVDLRQVGKRALEYLTKAGALDAFGSRHAILDVIEQLLSMSSALFHAREVGQLTFFGGADASGPQIVLPEKDDQNEFIRRERLNWERELIGLYVSDHPLTPMLPELAAVVTHFSSELSVLTGEERVRVAGLVKSLRSFPTKRGKMMAFVSIEDPQGIIDLVVFPSTWERYSVLIQMEKLIVVEGKMDAQSGESKVLVDKIDNKLTVVVQAEGDASPGAEAAPLGNQAPIAKEPAPKYSASALHNAGPEDFDLGDLPEPPDPFPPDWDLTVGGNFKWPYTPASAGW